MLPLELTSPTNVCITKLLKIAHVKHREASNPPRKTPKNTTATLNLSIALVIISSLQIPPLLSRLHCSLGVSYNPVSQHLQLFGWLTNPSKNPSPTNISTQPSHRNTNRAPPPPLPLLSFSSAFPPAGSLFPRIEWFTTYVDVVCALSSAHCLDHHSYRHDRPFVWNRGRWVSLRDG